MADQVPAGTYLGAAISAMKKRYDRIIIFSDMQTWMESNDNWGRSTRRDHQKLLTEYELEYKVKPYIYSIDLTGYGTTNWSQGRIVQVAGLSDKIFDLIAMVEQDRDVLIHEIEKIVI
jgi:hypothetical protein